MKVKNDKLKRRTAHLILYLLLGVFVLISLFPIVYTFLNSFKTTLEIYSSSRIMPEAPTMANYIKIWTETNVARGLVNSLILCVTSVIGALLTNSMTAYVMARRPKMKIVKILSKAYTAALFVSLPVVTMYPTYRLIVGLGLNQTMLGMILVYFGGGVSNIFLMKGNILGINPEIDEAAKIDGCSFFRIYWNIICPLSGAIFATVALLTFRGVWNAYLTPLVLTMGMDRLKTLTVAILELRSSGNNPADIGITYAGAAISILPMVILFICFNKYFMGNVTAGAIKG